ncbi:F-box protein CPR1-like [Papaver somniferum]|uniref:F-box protein CPR1-like n=1 Tax=Papaver somniferum TaxID=3469 RepID=UPI000E6F6C63|nr:F-box protein CPR1-like [Papaver somniferum]
MSSLPEEIYLEILLMVPVKSTFLCKSVCRNWFRIISDPDFDKLHLHVSTQRNNCRVMIISFFATNVYSITYDSLSSSSESKSSDDAFLKMDFPYNSSRHETGLKGSCNGLVYGCNYKMKFYFLWNPATTEYKRLPHWDKSEDAYFNRLGDFYGFGYDYKTDDYKLVTIHINIEDILVQLYSLKSNSWKSFETIGHGLGCFKPSGVLCNGALHWFGDMIGEMTPGIIVVSVDISDEKFQELQLPMTLPPTQYKINMAVLEGCLCVLANFEETFEVWVMSDYGVTDSWTKLHSITNESIMCDSFFCMELIGSFKNGEILFRNSNNVILYDPKYGTARNPNVHRSMVQRVMTYFESLISLNSITAVGRRKERKINRNLKESCKSKKRNRNVL